jgi:hypothetical protein
MNVFMKIQTSERNGEVWIFAPTHLATVNNSRSWRIDSYVDPSEEFIARIPVERSLQYIRDRKMNIFLIVIHEIVQCSTRHEVLICPCYLLRILAVSLWVVLLKISIWLAKMIPRSTFRNFLVHHITRPSPHWDKQFWVSPWNTFRDIACRAR